MSYGQSGPMSKRIAKRASRFQFQLQFAAVCALIALLLSLSACGGLATPASGSTSSATHSSSSLTIVPVPASALVGSTYNATLNVSGGTAPYLFTLVSGALPTGMSLNDETGNISGTPTSAATFNFGVSVSDAKGLSKQQPLQIVVANPTGGNQNQTKSFYNLQQNSAWGSYGQGPPDFVDCSPSPCDGITYAMKQAVSSPSISGSSTRFDLGGTAIYSDALFNNHLIGAFSSQGLPDNNKTLVPAYHNFTYDVYFYGTNLELSQAVEFDMNQFFDGLGFIWGHECRIAGGHEWDVWNNVTAHWTPTGIPCNPVNNGWNHLTIQVQRTADNKLLYQSITLNGVTNQLNQYYDPGAAPGWYGITINYQMDGNYKQSPYSVYLDQLTFSYE
jgi:hypothetical protein